MNLRQLRWHESRQLDSSTVEVHARLDPRIEEAFDWRIASGPEATIRQLFLEGLSVRILTELRSLAQNVFILTNDGPEGRPEPYDFGSMSEHVLKRHSWLTVRCGFSSDWKFGRDLPFDNYIGQLVMGDFSDFVGDLLGEQPHPLRYWFCFAREDVRLENIANAVESATSDEALKIALAKASLIIAYGFEAIHYTFITADSAIAKTLPDSFEKV